jgi:hypothetical protein
MPPYCTNIPASAELHVTLEHSGIIWGYFSLMHLYTGYFLFMRWYTGIAALSGLLTPENVTVFIANSAAVLRSLTVVRLMTEKLTVLKHMLPVFVWDNAFRSKAMLMTPLRLVSFFALGREYSLL